VVAVRRRSRGSSGRRGRLALAVALLVVVSTLSPLPAVSTTFGELGRSTAVEVSSDETGIVALNVSSALREDATNCLVEVTNNHDRTVTTTVSLDAGSQDDGDLVVPSGESGNGDEVTVDVPSGGTQQFEMTVNNNTSGTTVYFDVSATTDGASFTFPDRSSPITGSANPDTCE
jgi:hypothetical protein